MAIRLPDWLVKVGFSARTGRTTLLFGLGRLSLFQIVVNPEPKPPPKRPKKKSPRQGGIS